MGVLDSLVRETADFLAFFNETAKQLENCDFACLAQCNTTTTSAHGLLIETKVNCLDLCGCYRPSVILTKHENENGNERPISNVTLLKIAEKLETKNMSQADIQFQMNIARELYVDELNFEQKAKDLD